MYSLTSRHRGSAILIALVVITLLTIMSTVFFEKLYRFSQASEGIENSNVAYYLALGSIENALYGTGVNKYTPWNVTNSSLGSTTSTGLRLTVLTGSTTIPIAGKGNSDYDASKNYNIISLGQPIQLVVPEGVNWNNVLFEFRIPAMGGSTSSGLAFTMSNTGLIVWTIASSGASLFASGETEIFQGNKINIGGTRIDAYNGITNGGAASTFGSFYATQLGTNGAVCVNFQCTLKLSLIRPIMTSDNRTLSFLEYKISLGSSTIPLQYMNLHAEGYAHGFLRAYEKDFPQITTNTALDFAVLQ